MKKKYILKAGHRRTTHQALPRHSSFKPRYPSAVAEVMADLKKLTEKSGGIQYQFDYLGYKPLDHIA